MLLQWIYFVIVNSGVAYSSFDQFVGILSLKFFLNSQNNFEKVIWQSRLIEFNLFENLRFYPENVISPLVRGQLAFLVGKTSLKCLPANLTYLSTNFGIQFLLLLVRNLIYLGFDFARQVHFFTYLTAIRIFCLSGLRCR